jgi:hypothetical protein
MIAKIPKTQNYHSIEHNMIFASFYEKMQDFMAVRVQPLVKKFTVTGAFASFPSMLCSSTLFSSTF